MKSELFHVVGSFVSSWLTKLVLLPPPARPPADNTASILTLRGGFLQREQLVHFLPVVISDGSALSLSSTNTLSITVCTCDGAGNHLSCSWGPSPLLAVSLGAAATAMLLTCILTLLGKSQVMPLPNPFVLQNCILVWGASTLDGVSSSWGPLPVKMISPVAVSPCDSSVTCHFYYRLGGWGRVLIDCCTSIECFFYYYYFHFTFVRHLGLHFYV